MDVTVRPAQVADADAIGSIHVRAWQHGYRGQLPDEYLDGLSVPQRQRAWRERLAAGLVDNDLDVAEDPVDGHVCGFVSAGVLRADGTDELDAASTGEVWALNLEPEAWGRGIATALLRVAERRLAAAGRTDAILWVLATNARGRRFYEREGWVADGAAKVDDRDTVALEELRYRRSLSRAGAE